MPNDSETGQSKRHHVTAPSGVTWRTLLWCGFLTAFYAGFTLLITRRFPSLLFMGLGFAGVFVIALVGKAVDFVMDIGKTVKATQEGMKNLKESLNRISAAELEARASMHDYLAEQAAWKKTERLDGRTDDVEKEYNPESHDLVVKAVKCTEVANDYCSGTSVPQSPELAEVWYRRAVPWYELAAKKGDSYAQEKLGDLYSQGRGVQRDHAQAVYWWCEAAKRGRASAQYGLGEQYYFGRDVFGRAVQKDLAEALFWFDIVTIGQSAGFIELKRQAARYRNDAAKSIAPAELTQVQVRVKKWLEEHPAKP